MTGNIVTKIIQLLILASIPASAAAQNCPSCFNTLRETHTFPTYNNILSKESNGKIQTNGFEEFYLGTDFAEPYIASNPLDPLNSVCVFINSVYVTIDGCNWRKTALTNVDPFVCFDASGSVYFTRLNGPNLTINRSTNKGINWLSPLTIYSGAPDKWSIIADKTSGPFSNTIYAVWQEWQSSTRLLRITRSTNRGLNWGTPVKVNSGNQAYCPWAAIGPNGSIEGGSVYYAFNTYDSNSDTIRIIVRRSTNSAESFLPESIVDAFKHPGETCNNLPQKIKNCIDVNACVQMAADNSSGPSRGNVYLVYTVNPPGTDKADINFTRSTNYGVNWSKPVKLNDDNTESDQWLPSISADINGRIYCTWYDSRQDPLNIQTKLYGTISTDGGNTFIPNEAVSLVSFNPNNLAGIFSGYMGDYNGVSSIGSTSLAAWTDGRFNNFGSFSAYYPDFAMLVQPEQSVLDPNDSIIIKVKIPAIKGPFNDVIKFTLRLDSLPAQGNIEFSFLNSDSIVNVPDSIYVKLKTVNVNNPRIHKLIIRGESVLNIVPVHERIFAMQIVIGINVTSTEIPSNYSLSQNYPNPFNPVTKINFSLPEAAEVTLNVYDIEGKIVKELVKSSLQASSYSVFFDGTDLPSGVYFYKLATRWYTQSKKMIVVK
jgi:hypothetical protein